MAELHRFILWFTLFLSKPSMIGKLFVTECTNRMYGDRCQNECGHCKYGLQCHYEKGTCLYGCDPGFEQENCQKREHYLH